MLSGLNQKPELKVPCQNCQDRRENGKSGLPSKIFNGDSFIIPQNDVDAMLRVNMWNPVVSAAHLSKDAGAHGYRNFMNQQPFRRGFPDMSRPMPIQNDLERSQYPGESVDFFNPIKKIRLSITRLDNAVSFCRTHVETSKTNSGRRETRASHSAGSKASRTSREENHELKGDNYDPQLSMRMKPPINDPFSERLVKPTRFEQKIMPLPDVKIQDAVAASHMYRDTGSLSAKQGLLERSSRRVEFDLPARSVSNVSGIVQDSNKKEPIIVGIGSKPVAGQELDKDENLKTLELNTVDSTPRSELRVPIINSARKATDANMNDLNEKDKKLREVAKETLKTIQGVKISMDNKKHTVDSGSLSYRQREANIRHTQRAIKKAPVASGVGQALIITHLSVPNYPSAVHV